MKKTLLALSLAALTLSACQTELPLESEPEAVNNGTIWEELTRNNGDFTFEHKPTDSQYSVDVLYKGESVGSIEKDLLANNYDGYDVYLMEEAGNKAFIGVDPVGLGGYILYGYAFEVYVYDFANQTFGVLPIFEMSSVRGVDDISADGNLIAYWMNGTGYEFAAGELWGLVVYDLSQDVNQKLNVSSHYVDGEFEECGHATFSPSGKNLAFECADKDDTENGEEHVLFLGAAVGGEYKEMGRQVNEYFSMDWEANEILEGFEAANQ